MSRSRFGELYALHALEALDASERESFEAHLATGCPECREGLAQARAVLPALALSVPAEDPPASLRERILLRARGESTPPPVRRPSPVRRLLPLSLAASPRGSRSSASPTSARATGNGSGSGSSPSSPTPRPRARS